MDQHAPDTVEDAADALPPEDGVLPAVEITGEPAELVADNDIASSPVPAPSRSRHFLRGAMRTFLVLSLSQYVLTAILVILAALVISNQASDILVGKFDTLTRAIRRF